MKAKIITYACSLFLISSISSPLSAGSSGITKVNQLDVDVNSQVLYVMLVNDNNGSKPTCHTNAFWDYIVSLTTNSGKAAYAMLLAAQAQNKELYIVGTTTCTTSTENIHHVVIQ